MKKFSLFFVAICGSIFSSYSLAQVNVQDIMNSAFVNKSSNVLQTLRYSFGGFGGPSDSLMQADIMSPVMHGSSSLIFANLEGRYGENDSYAGNLGIGYRGKVNPSYLAGGYIFAGKSYYKNQSKYWIINPGFEVLGRNWDLHINGYIPLGKTHWRKDVGWADTLGVYKYMQYTGNTLYDHMLTRYRYRSIGPGVDADVGYVLPCKLLQNKLKVDLGVYTYALNKLSDAPNHVKDQIGVSGKVSYIFNKHITIEAKNVYDNLEKNSFIIGLRVNLGNSYYSNLEDIDSRLLDPVVHNISSTGGYLIKPVTKTKTIDVRSGIEKDHIIFFTNGGASVNGAGGVPDGTFEHPYLASELNQATLDHIKNDLFSDYANLYLQQRVNYQNAINLQLRSGQNIYGRSTDYFKDAPFISLPQIHGTLSLEGQNSVNYLQLFNLAATNNSSIGINVDGATGVSIDHVKVGMDTNVNNTNNYNTGILVTNGSQVSNITNSEIYATNKANNNLALGIAVNGASSVGEIGNNTIEAYNTGVSTDATTPAGAVGILIGGLDSGLFSADGKGVSPSLPLDGIQLIDNNKKIIVNSAIENGDFRGVMIDTGIWGNAEIGLQTIGVKLGNISGNEIDASYSNSGAQANGVDFISGLFAAKTGDVSSNKINLTASTTAPLSGDSFASGIFSFGSNNNVLDNEIRISNIPGEETVFGIGSLAFFGNISGNQVYISDLSGGSEVGGIISSGVVSGDVSYNIVSISNVTGSADYDDVVGIDMAGGAPVSGNIEGNHVVLSGVTLSGKENIYGMDLLALGSLNNNFVQITNSAVKGSGFGIYGIDVESDSNAGFNGNQINVLGSFAKGGASIFGVYNKGALSGLFSNNKITITDSTATGGGKLYGIYNDTDGNIESSAIMGNIINITNGGAPSGIGFYNGGKVNKDKSYILDNNTINAATQFDGTW